MLLAPPCVRHNGLDFNPSLCVRSPVTVTSHPVCSSTSNFKNIEYVCSCKRLADLRVTKVPPGAFTCNSPGRKC